mmetsp:Transcript_15563/g.62665  ORF Transcript_15563/g.62665 Transcript_15563/m.62665 type:complete len:246 (+) Transcript_15563:2324-3061(+)
MVPTSTVSSSSRCVPDMARSSLCTSCTAEALRLRSDADCANDGRCGVGADDERSIDEEAVEAEWWGAMPRNDGATLSGGREAVAPTWTVAPYELPDEPRGSASVEAPDSGSEARSRKLRDGSRSRRSRCDRLRSVPWSWIDLSSDDRYRGSLGRAAVTVPLDDDIDAATDEEPDNAAAAAPEDVVVATISVAAAALAVPDDDDKSFSSAGAAATGRKPSAEGAFFATYSESTQSEMAPNLAQTTT